MKDSIFREYDIRGRVGIEFDLSCVYALGKALACYFLEQHKIAVKTVAIGMDGRIDSPFIKQELERALRDSGLHVIYIGVCPTPVLYFALHTIPVDAGIMITASHNNKEFNGLKICIGKQALWGSEIEKIKTLYKQKKEQKSLFIGSYREYPLVDRYINWLAIHFKHLKNSTIPLIIDCGNGAASVIMRRLIAQLGLANITLLYDTLDGNFPHHEPDPSVLEHMHELRKRAIQDKIVGIGFDGDADRMVPITELGNLILGDKLLALFAQHIATQKPELSVICDIKCSASLMQLLANWGVTAHMVPSGHSIIKYHMKKQQALLAGELSCHFFFADRYFGYDDGIYAALRLYEIMREKHEVQLEPLLAFFPSVISTPEIRIAYDSNQERTALMHAAQAFFEQQNQAEICTIDGVRVTMPYGWGLVRFSNTQPVLSLRFEATTSEGLQQIQQDFYGALKDHIDIRTHTIHY
jgi:phosphomannomutase / phosphoglucomutase